MYVKFGHDIKILLKLSKQLRTKYRDTAEI